MNKWVPAFLVTFLLLSSIIAGPEVSANSLEGMKQEKKIYDEKKTELQSGINQKKSEISSNQAKVENLSEQIKALDTKVKETNNKIEKVEVEIAETKKEVEALHSSIEELEKRIAERDLVLRERARALQVTGGTVNYLDVLLGANSFSDFIDRYSAVSTLVEADKKIMQEQADDKEQLEVEKKLVEQKLKEQEERKQELSDLKASLDNQKKEKDQLVEQLKVAQKKLSKEQANLETSYDENNKMSQKVELEIVVEQERQLEVARKAAEKKQRLAEEAAAAAVAAKEKAIAKANAAAKSAQSNKVSKPSSSNSTKSSVAQSGQASVTPSVPAPPPAAAPSVSSGSWTKPANGRFTSRFGYRTHPITGTQRLHSGVDIAAPTGTPIVAAGDGVVFRAGWHSSYGNHVMITHSMNGKTYTTVYAHMSSMNASVGQVVSAGQNIGKIGTTGASTGAHLHFELHNGTYSGSGAINPVGIVPL